MEIEIRKSKDVTILSCTGSLDAETLPVFKKATQKLYQDGVRRFVIEAGQLTFIDSMGLGALISLLRQVKEMKGDIKIANMTSDVRSIFEITRLHRLFDVCPTVNDACSKFTHS